MGLSWELCIKEKMKESRFVCITKDNITTTTVLVSEQILSGFISIKKPAADIVYTPNVNQHLICIAKNLCCF